MLLDSDRAGGLGELDIWVSFRLDGGGWGEPINLGPEANSRGHDNCPRLTPDGKFVFFSSDRAGAGSDLYWVSSNVLKNLRSTTN